MKRAAALIAGVWLCALVWPAWAADPFDWPAWRGPEQNNTSRETGLIDSWNPRTGENVLWYRDDLITRSTPIVMNGRVYLLNSVHQFTPREAEQVLCLDPQTGETLWAHTFNIYLTEAPGERAAWSNVVGDPETGYVYAMGLCDYFCCLDGETGKVVWERSLHEEFGALSTYGGRTNSPIIVEDLVIISAIVVNWGDYVRPAHRFMAFDKRTGELVWFNGTRPLPYDTNYSTPFVSVIGGQLAMVFGSGDGAVWALQPRTGQPIWKYQLSGTAGLNVSPIAVGDRVYMAHSEENWDDPQKMGAVLCIDGSKGKNGADITRTGRVWDIKEITAGKSSPILVDGRLWIVDGSGGLWILDPETGKNLMASGRSFKIGTVMNSTPLYADGKVYLCSTNGDWWILKPNANAPDGFDVLQRRLRLRGDCYGSPIVSHGRIYLPLTTGLYCLGKKDHQPSADPIPKPIPEPPVDDDPQPAHVQVVPAEVLLAPGQTQTFRVRLYNSRGQFLRESEAEFSVSGAGAITADGTFTASDQAAHEVAIVSAKVGELAGQARVRVVPPLPWKFDFESGQIPITWVGMRVRHIALDHDVHQALNKESPIARQLYVYLMFLWNTTGQTELTFDDRPPRLAWTSLVRFFREEFAAQGLPNPTLAQARALFEPALQLLQKQRVVARWSWSDAEPSDTAQPRLSLTLSPRTGGNFVAHKLDDIPVPGGTTQLGTNSQGWMGPVHLQNYTIQADVLGTSKQGRDLPDIGITAQRYSLALLGTHQKLEVRTWPTQRRIAKDIPFAWKPDVWYTLKFQVQNTGETTTLRGKCWERGTPEPPDWQIVQEDPQPNRMGSPGFVATARLPGAPLHMDNIVVVPNEAAGP
jgi:outer membrane protein assembly factor BamB